VSFESLDCKELGVAGFEEVDEVLDFNETVEPQDRKLFSHGKFKSMLLAALDVTEPRLLHEEFSSE